MKKILSIITIILLMVACKKEPVDNKIYTHKAVYEVISRDTITKHLTYGYDDVIRQYTFKGGVRLDIDVPVGDHNLFMTLVNDQPSINKIMVGQEIKEGVKLFASYSNGCGRLTTDIKGKWYIGNWD